MKLTPAEADAIQAPVAASEPLCPRCKETTYPVRWCDCDPRLQMADFMAEDAVILMQEDVE